VTHTLYTHRGLPCAIRDRTIREHSSSPPFHARRLPPRRSPARWPRQACRRSRTGRSCSWWAARSPRTLRVDQPYAQQRFLLDLTATAYRYAQLSYLDFDALDCRGVWAWQLGRRWSGTAGTEQAQSLVDYSQFGDRSQRNVLSAQRSYPFGGRLAVRRLASPRLAAAA